jgi:hypothetical protein
MLCSWTSTSAPVPDTERPRLFRTHDRSMPWPPLVRLSATVTPKYFPLYHFFPPISPPIFASPAAVPPKYSPIPHYHYKISFSIPTIKFLSTNNYSWTHSTVFRVMNSDTLDLGGERRGPTCRGRCRGHRCGHRVPPTRRMQGEGEVQRSPLRLVLPLEPTNLAIEPPFGCHG